MMRIEAIASKPDRTGRYLIRFENATTMRLYRQTVEDFGLYTGLDLSSSQLEELRVAAGQMSAKMRAVRIISATNVSKDDLQQRLIRKGESEDQAQEAVRWMEELNLLDDRRTAQHIVERCAEKGYGLARAQQALYEKRIPKSYWDEVLADYPDQTEHIISFLRSRLPKEPTERDRKRAIDGLLRRGHTYSQIQSGLRQLHLDEEFPEE
jgi:regulatory protein